MYDCIHTRTKKKILILIKLLFPKKTICAPTFSFILFSPQAPTLISITKNREETGPTNANESSHFYTHINVRLKTQSIWWYTYVWAVPFFAFRNLKQLQLLQLSLLWSRPSPLPRPARKHLPAISPEVNETNSQQKGEGKNMWACLCCGVCPRSYFKLWKKHRLSVLHNRSFNHACESLLKIS